MIPPAPFHTPINLTGTQSEVGSNGGMDSRFDMILMSNARWCRQVNYTTRLGTYEAIGNDGNHFNEPINHGINTVVPATAADKLVLAH